MSIEGECADRTAAACAAVPQSQQPDPDIAIHRPFLDDADMAHLHGEQQIAIAKFKVGLVGRPMWREIDATGPGDIQGHIIACMPVSVLRPSDATASVSRSAIQ